MPWQDEPLRSELRQLALECLQLHPCQPVRSERWWFWRRAVHLLRQPNMMLLARAKGRKGCWRCENILEGTQQLLNVGILWLR